MYKLRDLIDLCKHDLAFHVINWQGQVARSNNHLEVTRIITCCSSYMCQILHEHLCCRGCIKGPYTALQVAISWDAQICSGFCPDVEI